MENLWLVTYILLWVFVIIMFLLILATIRAVAVLLDTSNRVRNPAPTDLKVGEPLPDLVLQSLDNAYVSISSILGPRTVIHIISLGCHHCMELLASAVVKESVIDEIKHVIISLADVASTIRVLSNCGLPEGITVLCDSEGIVKDGWGIRFVPVTLIVDGGTLIRQVVDSQGYLSGEYVSPLLSGGDEGGTVVRSDR